MTPRRRKAKGYRDHKRGSLVLDRVFKGVGRVKRASGTTDAKVFGLMNAMLDTLQKGGRLDILKALKTKTLHPLEVWDAHRSGRLDQLPDPASLKALKQTAGRFVKHYKGRKGGGISERHRADMAPSFAALTELGGKDATLADLPRLLAEYRTACEGVRHRTFNKARAHVQALVRSVVGGRSRLHELVSEVEELAIERREGTAKTLPEALAFRGTLEPPYDDIWWSMLLTGMGPKELRGPWEVQTLGVQIGGTKREARRRVVPLLGRVVRPARAYKSIQAAFKRASGGEIEPYDARRTYAKWLEDADVPRARRKQYMGHAVQDVSDLYPRGEREAHLAEDAERLLAFARSVCPGWEAKGPVLLTGPESPTIPTTVDRAAGAAEGRNR